MRYYVKETEGWVVRSDIDDVALSPHFALFEELLNFTSNMN
jgi:hypothetical protein